MFSAGCFRLAVLLAVLSKKNKNFPHMFNSNTSYQQCFNQMSETRTSYKTTNVVHRKYIHITPVGVIKAAGQTAVERHVAAANATG